jgi:hypothetical protein
MSRYIDPDADVRAWLGPAWAALQAWHEDIPDCAFAPAPRGAPDRGLGAIAPPGFAWPDGSQIMELTVIIFPGWLYCCGFRAFEILMHEAAHALDYTRNHEVSGHGNVFAAFARELGLEPIPAEQNGRIHYDVRLTETLRVLYADVVGDLSNAWTELDAQRWVIG